MKRKACNLLAVLITLSAGMACLGACSYKPRDFLEIKSLGEGTRMPDSSFSWTYYRVLTGRMKEASGFRIYRETYVDESQFKDDGQSVKTVMEINAVVYSDYVVESTCMRDGELVEVETVSLVEENGEKKLSRQKKDANGTVTYEYISSWNESKEKYYYTYLIENSSINDVYLNAGYYSMSYYKKGDIYSCYGTKEKQSISGLLDVNNRDVAFHREMELLVQLKINDSVDRFERQYEHSIIRLEQDYHGNKTKPYCFSEDITEITAFYEERTVYKQ